MLWNIGIQTRGDCKCWIYSFHKQVGKKILQYTELSPTLKSRLFFNQHCLFWLFSVIVSHLERNVFFLSYNGKPDDTLTSLRYAMFMSMISKYFQLQPENLAPTERAAYYHSLRVHLQVCQWKSLQLDVLDATKRVVDTSQWALGANQNRYTLCT